MQVTAAADVYVPVSATFAYDALGRQTTLLETGAVSQNGGSQVIEQRRYYYDQAGNIIEEYDPVSGHIDTQYVWSPVTGQIVLRDYSTADNGTLDQRLFPLYDPQGNVVALVDGASNVIERYSYDPLGDVTAYLGNGVEASGPDDASKPSDQQLGYMYGTTSLIPNTNFFSGGSEQGWSISTRGCVATRCPICT